MKRARCLSILFAVVLLAVGVIAEAQQPTRIPRIGYLTVVSSSTIATASRPSVRLCASLDTWREKILSLSIDMRKENSIACRARGRTSASPGRRYCLGWFATNPCCQGSNLYDSHCHGADSDPVGNGFVASLARPGGNVTGLATLTPEISGKRLELLKETIPRLSRLAVLGSSTEPGQRTVLKRDGTRRPGVRGADSIPGRLDPRMFGPHSKPSSRGVLRQSLCCQGPSSTLTEQRS